MPRAASRVGTRSRSDCRRGSTCGTVRLAMLWRAEVIALGWPEGRYLKHRRAGVRRVA